MNLQDIIDTLELIPYTQPKDYSEIIPSSGYSSDLLSCVMAGAVKRSLWVTLQSHGNIIAVASLLDLAAVIITEGAAPDPLMIEKANEENVILLGTSKPTFYIIGKLWEMGLRNKQED